MEGLVVMSLPVLFPSLALTKRELVVVLRRRRVPTLMMGWIATACLVFWLGWPDTRMVAGATGRTNPQSYLWQALFWGARTSSGELLNWLWLVMLGGASLLLPGLAVTSVASERDRQTYDQLNLTLIRPWGVMLGKLFSMVIAFLLTVAGVLPLLGLALSLPGIDETAVLHCFVIATVAAAVYGAIGIAAGALFRRTSTALATAYMAVIAFNGLLPAGIAGVVDSYNWNRSSATLAAASRFFWAWAAGVAPPGAILRAGVLWEPVMIGVALGGGVVAVCLTIAAVVLNRPPLPAPVPRRIRRAERRRARRAKRMDVAAPPAAVDRWSDIDPVLGKELRLAYFRAARPWVATLAFFLIGAGLNTAMITWVIRYARSDFEGGIFFSMLLQLCFTAALLPLRAPGIFSAEHEGDTFDGLRMTLLGPVQVLRGKAAAALVLASPAFFGLGLAWLLTLAITLVLRGKGADIVLAGLGTLLVSTLLAVALGALAGTGSKGSATGLVSSYLLNLMAFVGVPISLGLAAEWQRSSLTFGELMFYSPILGFLASAIPKSWGTPEILGEHAVSWYWVKNVTMFLGVAAVALAGAGTLYQRQFRASK